MNKIYLASSNPEKVKEAQAILQIPLEIAKVDLDEIQSMDLEFVVRKKTEEAFRILKKPVIVDDVGLKIEAWNNFPGPLVKFVLQTIGNKKLLEILKGEKNRNIVAQGGVGYHDGNKAHVFIGEVKGKIAYKELGSDGWGFDFFFIPNGQTKTFAQLGFDKKNELSHRRAGLMLLKEYLNK